MRHTCPVCGGSGSANSLETTCGACLGRAVVETHVTICPACGGQKGAFCTHCNGARHLYRHEPYTAPLREVTIERIQRALLALKAGPLLPESAEIDSFALGVASALCTISADRGNRLGWQPGELFRGLQTGVLRLTDSGIWHFPDQDTPSGVQLVRHTTLEERNATTARQEG